MKSEILRLLKESDTYISGQQLCEQFQVSRTAIWKVIDQLKKEGYEIEAVRNKGYRLIDSPDVMSKAEIESLVDTKWAGKMSYITMKLTRPIIVPKKPEITGLLTVLYSWQICRWQEKAAEAVSGNHRPEAVSI